jgi:curved DNA-binding protein CbpA
LRNYYDILGLDKSAGQAEIKAAFRRLAKQYHPDKNPTGKEYFEEVLKAYETLSNPGKKRTYDYSLVHHHKSSTPGSQGTHGTTKNWKFDEKELRRRQYYNEHIKKHAKATAEYNEKAATKKTYNEYKYILFATPLAVALFLLIMSLANPAKEKSASARPKAPAEAYTFESIKTGDSPYEGVFGQSYFDSRHNNILTVNNNSSNEVVVCVFGSERFIRSCYIYANSSFDITMLPPWPLKIKFSSGHLFSFDKELPVKGAFGGFARDAAFYRSEGELRAQVSSEVSLFPPQNRGFVKTTETDFFNVH